MISIFAVDIQVRHHALWSCCDKPNVAFEVFLFPTLSLQAPSIRDSGGRESIRLCPLSRILGVERSYEIVEE